VPIFAFAVVAINVKIRAPNAHTFLEIVRARWGDAAHKVFFCFFIATNAIVTAMLLLGGASVMTQLTGISAYAACMLIPVSVAIKACWGGLEVTHFQSRFSPLPTTLLMSSRQATYFSSLLSTLLILTIVAYVSFRVYAYDDNGELGSSHRMWANLNAYAAMAVPDNPSAEISNMQLGSVDGTASRHLYHATCFAPKSPHPPQATSTAPT
jgi:hypothetical protein